MAKHSIPKSIPVPVLTDEAYERGIGSDQPDPFAVVEAKYDRHRDALELSLRKGITMSFPRLAIRELVDAVPAALTEVEIHPGGDSISFRSIDVDISVAGLLANELGTVFARQLGRKSKGRTSKTKAAASRANGRKGGRPRKRDVA